MNNLATIDLFCNPNNLALFVQINLILRDKGSISSYLSIQYTKICIYFSHGEHYNVQYTEKQILNKRYLVGDKLV